MSERKKDVYIKYNIMKVDGEINVDTGKVSVSDPGYDDDDVWCRLDNIEVKKGKYYGFAFETKDLAGWGNRIIALQIVHEDHCNQDTPFYADDNKVHWNKVGDIGVDAGLASFFKTGTKPNYDSDEWTKLCDNEFFNHNYGFVEKDSVIWSSSGIGDGCYPVYALENDKKEVISIVVDFMVHPWLGSEEEE